MIFLVIIVVIALLVYLPSFWVKRVMRRYEQPADRYPSSGGELARHLLGQAGLAHVRVEETDQGDHYDPMEKAVRLMPERLHGHSLTAVTVAAHEVGHALQDAENYAPLHLRTRLVKATRPLQRIGAGLLVAAPLITVALRVPSVTGVMLLGGLLTLGAATMVHMITLPTELDASFRRAMPLLSADGVLIPGDEPHAKRILTAAALTYVAVSMMSLLNIWRWFALLRR
jgi:Zn-dependent membrane protease YugP